MRIVEPLNTLAYGIKEGCKKRKPDSICRTIWSLNRCLIIYLEINRKNNQIYEKIHE